MVSLTVENYVKGIYQIGGDAARPVGTGELAQALRVSPSSVTSMLKSLADAELVDYVPYEGVRLTPHGKKLALRVLRRHRLLELFLTKTLGLSWDEVHEEAEHLEHAASDWLVDRIDAWLGHPDRDPHGDPIPSADGSVARQASKPLTELESGSEFVVVRVLDQSPEVLRYLAEAGIALDETGVLVDCRRALGVVTVRFGEITTALGKDAAEKIMVAPVAALNTANT